jgi:hypothetical protein
MKRTLSKILPIAALVASIIVLMLMLSMASCDNGTTSGPSGGGGLFSGHYDVYEETLSQKWDASTDEWIFESWENGGWREYKDDAIYFEGKDYYEFTNNKMLNGCNFNCTNTHITWFRQDESIMGVQRYTMIDKDTIYLHFINDDPSGISYGMSYNTNIIIKKSGRTGKVHPVDGSYTFVDD